MKEILTIILCFILFVGIVLAILFHEQVRKFKKILRHAADAREARKMAEEDEYFKRTSNKYYREDSQPKFQEDYFKSTEEQSKTSQKKQEATTRRTVETDSGVTIIDDRTRQKAGQKIFESGEGEYVEFEEV